MIVHDTQVRVRYADTDQMGYVYYGKFAEYFEVGRVELIRSLGISYKEVEHRGCLLPVVEFSVQYKAPAVYDDLLTITTAIPEIPRARFLTQYEVHNPLGQLIATGKVTLAFLHKEKQRPIKVPDYILERIEAQWKD